MQRFPGVQTIGSASYVPRAGLAAYTRRTRAAIAASGIIRAQFKPYPALTPDAQEALISDHLEPPPTDNRTFGLNFLSEPNRRRAALLARRTGQPAATAPIAFARLGGSSLGIDLMVPIYGGPPSLTGSPREWAGVVYAAFRIDNLLRGVLGADATVADMEVYDLGPAATVPASTGLTTRPSRSTCDPAARRTRAARPRPHARRDAGGRRPPLGRRLHARGLAADRRRARGPVGHRDRRHPRQPAGRRAAAHAGTARRRAVRLAESMTVELREREAQLRASNEELEHFAYLASHDLQEPLRTITSYVGLLDSRLGDKLDDRERSWLGFVSEGAARMSQLITDLLEYSRTGRAREDDGETIALDDAWDMAVANLQHAITDTGATVERGELPTVHAQPREMTSMLQNLIGNGLKYRGEAAPIVRAHAEQQRRPLGDRDQRQRHRDRATIPRARVRTLPATSHVRGVPWHRHGPSHRQEDRRVQRRQCAGRVDPRRGLHVHRHAPGGTRGMTQVEGTHRLLVVEDSESDVELLREALAESEPTVALDVVRHGEDALAFLRREGAFRAAARPDLVVLDLNLPRMGGFEVLRALREDVDPRLRRLPVVVFTTSGTTTDVEKAYDLHASSFVTKPTAFEHYLDTVRAFREFWLRVAKLPTGV